ncbi:hypothetical protein [Streptomyces sp. NBC_00582]|uniref:hypothetical protein n=1 Tax=Streptomyces sp. NBC_00582 TaxID=2975783 RepID=UPI002E820CA4|nr:hypothetical protein [Streptomyces sp. NBC_00582]WUB67462.1 hypothetical protein OG852_47265 [Streptomyces sp. NBC_00582]
MEQELLALLKQHEEAARRQVEGLRAEQAALNERITATRRSCPSWWSLRRPSPARSPNATRRRGVRAGARTGCAPDDLADPLPPVVRVAIGEVPAEGDWPVLALLASANASLRAKEICEVTEEVADHRHVETLRMRLKRMVRGEWLAEPPRGPFAVADGVRAPDRS